MCCELQFIIVLPTLIWVLSLFLQSQWSIRPSRRQEEVAPVQAGPHRMVNPTFTWAFYVGTILVHQVMEYPQWVILFYPILYDIIWSCMICGLAFRNSEPTAWTWHTGAGENHVPTNLDGSCHKWPTSVGFVKVWTNPYTHRAVFLLRILHIWCFRASWLVGLHPPTNSE